MSIKEGLEVSSNATAATDLTDADSSFTNLSTIDETDLYSDLSDADSRPQKKKHVNRDESSKQLVDCCLY